jgi:hypothetical protein
MDPRKMLGKGGYSVIMKVATSGGTVNVLK